ncbi:MAG TPA: hypothetical protein VLF43_05215, partial [Candidatus Saccharimonadales bacterium]|nr:hypothetical protein [Candidatus Saccharimonadales bacterium]
MAFGPEISVERVEIDSSKAGAVYLAPFAPADAASHFPFHWEDPGYNYLSGKTPATLRKSTPDNFYHLRTDGPGKVAWGIWDGDTFAGCVDIANIPDYS